MEGSVEFDIWASLVSDSRGPVRGNFVSWDVTGVCDGMSSGRSGMWLQVSLKRCVATEPL